MSPRIAVVTNISPNHLDVHDTMDAYIAAKSRILRFQGEEDILVVNRDNEHTVAMAKEARGRVVWFSRQREVADGAFVSGGRIVLSRDTHGGRSLVDVCGVDEIRLLGGHNLENVLAALAVAAQLGATPGTMREVVTSFTGVAHRLELVREHNGIAYFNDSIATSPNRSMAGLAAFDRPVHLIAGGYDKKLPFEELAEVICSRCATLHLIGETRMAIDKAVRDAATRVGKGPQIFHWDSFEEAVKAAAGAARSGDVVLLSPACASYDMFPNFQVRGERFRKLVHQVTEQDLPRVSPL